jgi:DNA repair exonuclease SbcCD nuclease subunit
MPVIAHISDIHIRSLKRHDEYISVFKKLSIDCRKNNVDYIFLGGDLFHTKLTGISPEYIELLTWWLNDLSSIAPVHIILGNHDLNVNNLTRQDAVSPIVSAMNNSKIRLYKNSGVYEFHPGWNWCVFSICDEENWNKVKPEKNKVNIACYHGPVSGAKTETGYELEGELTVSFFKDYDYVFLGDIHMFQFLGTKNVDLLVSEEELKNYSDYEIIEVFE